MKPQIFISIFFLFISQALFAQTSDEWLKKAIDNVNNNEYAAAIVNCNKALLLDSHNAVAFGTRGNANHRLGHNVEAINDYDRAVALDPKYVEAYNGRGLCKYYLTDYAEAIADFDKAISLDPKFALAYNYRGYAYCRLGNTKENYQKAINDYDTFAQLVAISKIDYYPVFQYRDDAEAAINKLKGLQ